MQKNEQSSRQIVMCYLTTIMGIDIEKAIQIIDEMEQTGLIQFDEFENVGLLVLEDSHETYYRKSVSDIRALL